MPELSHEHQLSLMLHELTLDPAAARPTLDDVLAAAAEVIAARPDDPRWADRSASACLITPTLFEPQLSEWLRALQTEAGARGVELSDEGGGNQWCCGFTFLVVREEAASAGSTPNSQS